MNDRVGAVLAQQRLDTRGVANIKLDQSAPGVCECTGQVGFLGGTVVKRVEVVDHDDFVAVSEQPVNQMGANEARSAGHDGFHRENASAVALAPVPKGRSRTATVAGDRPA